MRILNAEPLGYSATASRILQEIGKIDHLDLSRADLIKALPSYDVLIVRLRTQIDQEVIDAGQRLRVIVSATTGTDHIDLDYAKARGIKVLCLRGETEFLRTIPATAEHTWALLLALTRRIPWAFQSVLNSSWDRDLFRGNDLSQKRLGIVGLGRIGEQVAQFGVTFGMQVGFYDAYRATWPSNITRYKLLSDLLRQTDILSIHVPFNGETEHLIGRAELNTLPECSWLINTSRGAILDEEALIEALETGRLRGAAVDVLSGEQELVNPSTHPLIAYAIQHDNLLITPHIGGATWESMWATEMFMATYLAQYLKGR